MRYALLVPLVLLLTASASATDAVYQATLDAYTRFIPRYYAVETMARFTDVAKPNQLPQAPLNQLGYRDDRTDFGVSWIVRANVDTVFAAGFVDLSEGPMLLKVPKEDKRYWRVQVSDLWTEVAPSSPSSLSGSKPGVYAIVGPNYAGDSVPGADAGLIRATEDLNFVIIRVGYKKVGQLGALGPEVSKSLGVLRQFTLSPAGSKPAKKAKKSGKAREFQRSLHVATAELAKNEPKRLLKKIHAAASREGTPLTDEDQQLLDTLSANLQAAEADTQVASKMIEAVVAARRLIDTRARRGKEGDNGWVNLKAGKWEGRYLDRAAGAEYALFADSYVDVMHYEVHVDEYGEPLKGDRRYLLAFLKGRLPPADHFWSVSSYRDDTLAPGETSINRTSIGDLAYRLKVRGDGTTLLFVQHQELGQGKSISWLPTPQGSFNLVLRVYGPTGPTLDGSYKVPPVLRSEPGVQDPWKKLHKGKGNNN